MRSGAAVSAASLGQKQRGARLSVLQSALKNRKAANICVHRRLWWLAALALPGRFGGIVFFFLFLAKTQNRKNTKEWRVGKGIK